MAEQVRMRGGQHTWTEEHDAMLKKHWHDGLSCSQIARQLIADGCPARTRNAIIGRVHRMGLPKRALTNSSCRAYQPERTQRQRRQQGALGARATISHMLSLAGRKVGEGPLAGATAERLRRRNEKALRNTDPVDPVNVTLDDLEFGMCRAVASNEEWGRPTYCGHPVIREGASYCIDCASRFYVTIEKKPRRLGASGVNRRADYRDSARWGAR